MHYVKEDNKLFTELRSNEHFMLSEITLVEEKHFNNTNQTETNYCPS